MTDGIMSSPLGDDFDPASFRAAGIPPEEGRRWWRWRLSAAQARAWREAGVVDPVLAMQWSTAHVTPRTVDAWRSAGLSAAEAVGWHEYEFELGDAARYKRQGLSPDQAFNVRRGRAPRAPGDPSAPGDAISGLMQQAIGPQGGDAQGGGIQGGDAQGGGVPNLAQRFVARAGSADAVVILSYVNGDWLDDEATAWVRRNVDAATARLWKELGLRPAEAEPFIRRGMSAVAVARAWWRAGIPFEETASWIGAGLNPKEAVRQRAAGVTAAQAEILRALRDPERLDG